MLPRKIRRYEKLEHGLQANSYFGKEGGVALLFQRSFVFKLISAQ